jgi:hypothetical protein
MESNKKNYEEDNDNQDDFKEITGSQLSTFKIESLLDEKKDSTTKVKNNNKFEYNSSTDEEFYSDVGSDNNSNNKIEGNSTKIKKAKTEQEIQKMNEKFNKELRKSNYIESKLITSIEKKENANRENLDLAGKINFKTIPDKIIETDEFGFLKKVERPGETPYENKDQENKTEKNDLLLINSRTEKWIYMLEHYDLFSTKKFSKLKQRTRKGIPDNLRSNVWQLFGEMKKYYKKDLFNKISKEKLDEDTEETIIKDLDRTYPSCQLFTDKYGNGQRKLFKVLSCYSLYNKEIGYVQGMSFIVALFLIYMDEESTFFMLDSVMNKYEMKGIYLPGFPDLKKKFYVLLNLEKKFLPKIYEVFKRDNILPSLYSSEWFLCLFTKDLKFKYVVRIFDVFLLEGFKVIYRFALAFLKLREKSFIQSNGIMETMNALHETLDNVDVETIFNVAFGFHLSKDQIKKYEAEYEKNKNNNNDEFMSQL